MKSVLIIGMGRFGQYLSRKFVELGHEVMAVDTDEQNIHKVLPFVTNAQIGDCTNEDVLRSFGVTNFDICFVCIGNNFQSSLEITSLLKDLGAKYVISRATREIHAKFLLRNGADEVAYPEKDNAEKLAVRCSTDNLFDFIELSKEISIYEIPPMDTWIGKTIRQLGVRTKYRVSILAVKDGDNIAPLPGADYVFKKNERLIVLGRHTDVDKILRHLH